MRGLGTGIERGQINTELLNLEEGTLFNSTIAIISLTKIYIHWRHQGAAEGLVTEINPMAKGSLRKRQVYSGLEFRGLVMAEWRQQ